MYLLFLSLLTIAGITAIWESVRVFAETKVQGEHVAANIPVTLLIGTVVTAVMLLCIDYVLKIGFWA